MRIAVIDCGTNTFHLLIVDTKQNGGFETVLRENIAVKLGEAGITKNFISEAPFQRGIDTLKNFKKIILKNKIEAVHAYATAGVRNAVNGEDFLQRVKEETGFEITLIDGQREAELIYYGVKQAVTMDEEASLIMDIGGGSVEFIIANNTKIFWKHSFELGAALLLEKFNPSDPITPHELKEINSYLEKELIPLINQIKNSSFAIRSLIGSSGSFDTFADMVYYRFHSNENKPSGTEYKFDINEYNEIYNRLLHSTTEQRIKMKGLIPMRVDMIVIASILLTFVLEKSGITNMKLSAFALKEGILFSTLNP